MNIVTKKRAFENEEEVKGKVIQKGWLAALILKQGGEDVRIIDLKPDRDDHTRTVFVFRDDDKFQKVLTDVLNADKKRRFEEAVNKEVEARLKEKEAKQED